MNARTRVRRAAREQWLALLACEAREPGATGGIGQRSIGGETSSWLPATRRGTVGRRSRRSALRRALAHEGVISLGAVPETGVSSARARRARRADQVVVAPSHA